MNKRKIVEICPWVTSYFVVNGKIRGKEVSVGDSDTRREFMSPSYLLSFYDIPDIFLNSLFMLAH